MATASYEDDPTPEHDAAPNHLQLKDHRHVLFVEWLLQTYGREYLSTGSGVLDVAGGKGAIGRALAVYGVPSVLLEPCPRVLSPEEGPSSDSPHIVASLLGDGGDILSRGGRDAELVSNCSLIVGLHADQATEPIVDLALRLSKPFATVPCCVFPTLFPHRRQARNGHPVRGYKTFCAYLLEKRPVTTPNPFYSAELPFKGKRTVIYQLPVGREEPTQIEPRGAHGSTASAEAMLAELNEALGTCQEAGEWSRALALLEEGAPDAASFALALGACVPHGQWRPALKILARMRRRGIAPGADAVAAAAAACERGGQWDKAADLCKGLG